MIPLPCLKRKIYVTEIETPTEETPTEETPEVSITQRIDENIDEDACKNRFQEFIEKRNDRIYKKVMFNIRNYVILTEKEISEIRLLNDAQKMNIIILMNTAIKYSLKFV